MAALSFDFFHTQPYLSLTISDSEDILATILLLGVALVVGGLSARATAEHQRARDDEQTTARPCGACSRVAVKGDAEDVELAVRAELDRPARAPGLPVHQRPARRARARRPTASCPTASSATRTRASSSPPAASPSRSSGAGRTFGWFVCRPVAGVGVHVANRRSAVALAEILGLSAWPCV